MNKISSLIIMLVFLLSGCYASFQPASVQRVHVVKKNAYVYIDHMHGTEIYLPYRISVTSRYSFVRHIRNYRGRYRTHTRYFTSGRKKVNKPPKHRKRHPPSFKKQGKRHKKKKSNKH